jgi:hypothetical protein
LIASGLTIVLLLVASSAARRALARANILVPLLTAGGLVLAYTAAAASGSPHLKYGFMRDYVAPMALLTVVALGLLSAVRRDGRAGLFRAGVSLLLLCTVGLMMLRPVAGSVLPQFALGGVSYSASCAGDTCGFTAAVVDRAGRPVDIATDTVYRKSCGGRTEEGVATLETIRLDRSACSSIFLVPAATGLYQTPEPIAHIDQPAIPAPDALTHR